MAGVAIGLRGAVTFIASKLIWSVLAPGNLLLLLLIFATLRLVLSKGARGRGVLAVVTLAFFAFAVLPLGAWLAAPLENRFPLLRDLPAHIDGIILLGGAVDAELSHERGQVQLDEAAERVTETAALARRYPEARIVVSGGENRLLPRGLAEAEATRRLLLELGVAADRITTEDASRNTWENALFSYRTVRPRAGEKWLLVTSAMHMPRAMGCFRRAGWPPLEAYPVDYRSPPRVPLGLGFEFPAGLDLANQAAKEWLGLVAYRLLGRTDALFPSPSAGGGGADQIVSGSG